MESYVNKCVRVKTGMYTKCGINVSVNYLVPCNVNTFRKKYCLCKRFGFCCENVIWEDSRFINSLYRIKNYGNTLQNVIWYARLWTTATQGIPTWDQRPVTAFLNEEALRQRMPSFRLKSKLLGYKNCVSINFDDSNKCWNGVLAFSHWYFVPVHLGQIENFERQSER